MAANLVYAEVLTTGKDGLGPCVLLSVERRAAYSDGTTVLRRYMFDAPEEIVRFSGSQQVKLGTLAAVFATSGTGAAGLAELVLASAEQGLQRLHVRGPPGIVKYTHTITETIANPRNMQVLPAVASPGLEALCYEDEHLQVWAIAASTTTSDTDANSNSLTKEPPQKRPRLHGAQHHNADGATTTRVGYQCRLRHGGAGLLVMPNGCNAIPEVLDASDPGSTRFVFHLGARPPGAGANEVGLCSQGRQRGLWKSHERLSRWSCLCPEVCQDVTRPLQEQATNGEPSEQPVLRAYLRPIAQLEAGRDEPDKDTVKETLTECEEWGLRESLETARTALVEANADGAQTEDPELLFLGTGSAPDLPQRAKCDIAAHGTLQCPD